MSSSNQVLNTGQQAITNYDVSKIFLWNNRYETGSYNNSGYEEVTLPAGRLMGRVSATQMLVPHDSSASDGSQFPVGILNKEHIVAEGDTVNVSICVSGDVEESLITLAAGDTLNTVIDGRSIRDRIGADTVGIKLVAGTELTGYDNQ